MLFLEVTGSFDECLSVANEKGWERKLPLIRSFKGPFFYRMPLLLIFTEARNPRCSWGRCGAAGCLKTCLGSPCLCLGTLPHPCSWAGRCFLGHTSPDQQHPLLSEDSLADAVLLVFQPMFAKQCLFLCFVSPLGLAGNEPLSWPAASSGRKAAKWLPAENTVC